MWCFGNKNKTFQCKIILLDESELLQEVEIDAKGQVLLNSVFSHLNLLESAYFGLRYLDSSSQTHWLDPVKKVIKQIKGAPSFTLYFGVKFYSPEPCKLVEEITRYQFFLQVKQDILQGRLPVSFELASELFALFLQSELGDYDNRRHQPAYVSEFIFTANQSPELEARAAELHKGLFGQVPSEAEMHFLDRIKWHEMYGADLHPVLGEENIEYFLGVTPSGLVVMKNKTKVGNYFWPRITKLNFRCRNFIIKVKDKNNQENTYGFQLPTKQACKHLWKCAVEHHAFFRLSQVKEFSRQPSKLFSFGSQFRYSGRTQSQIQTDLKQQRRSPPTVVRLPSKHYEKRLGQSNSVPVPSTEVHRDKKNPKIMEINLSVPQTACLSLYRSISIPASLQATNSSENDKTVPWNDPELRGLFSSISKSPSVNSIQHIPYYRRTSFAESDGSRESQRKRRYHRRRKIGDNDSDISKSSRGSRASRSSKTGSERSRRKRSSDQNSGSETESQHRRRSRKSQNETIKELNKKSGYANSGGDTESEINYSQRRKQRRHRSISRSPEIKKALPSQVKRHIAYGLVDSANMTEEEKKNIKYTKIGVIAKPECDTTAISEVGKKLGLNSQKPVSSNSWPQNYPNVEILPNMILMQSDKSHELSTEL